MLVIMRGYCLEGDEGSARRRHAETGPTSGALVVGRAEVAKTRGREMGLWRSQGSASRYPVAVST